MADIRALGTEVIGAIRRDTDGSSANGNSGPFRVGHLQAPGLRRLLLAGGLGAVVALAVAGVLRLRRRS